jgi:butyrate kinase
VVAVSEKTHRILTINPGSTSTKASIYEDDVEVWDANVVHSTEELAAIETIREQGPYRRDAVLAAMKEAGYEPTGFDAVVGVGGVGLAGVEYGTYSVNGAMLKDASVGRYGTHPNNLGVIISAELAEACGAPAYAAGMASSEEFEDVAHVGGFVDTPRRCMVHMLNTKEVAIRHAASLGADYSELNLVIAHVGGGITVAAHRAGKVIDATDGIAQDGPMSPNRPGTVALIPFVDLCFADGATKDSIKKRVMAHGGLLDHLGTVDVPEIKKMIDAGDEYAKLVYDALLYQVAKHVGMFAAVLKGKVDYVILTGGLMKDDYGVKYITEMVDWIAPVAVYPGELEQEALAAAALRVLRGKEELLTYTGTPVWSGFDHLSRA